MKPHIIYACEEGVLDQPKLRRFCDFWLRFRLKQMMVRNGHQGLTPAAQKDLKSETALCMWDSEMWVQKNPDRFMKNYPSQKYSCVVCHALVVGARWCPDCWKNRKKIESQNLARALEGGSLADPVKITFGDPIMLVWNMGDGEYVAAISRLAAIEFWKENCVDLEGEDPEFGVGYPYALCEDELLEMSFKCEETGAVKTFAEGLREGIDDAAPQRAFLLCTENF